MVCMEVDVVMNSGDPVSLLNIDPRISRSALSCVGGVSAVGSVVMVWGQSANPRF